MDLGRQISEDYAGRLITIVAILNGSFVFLADLIRRIDSRIPVEVDFIAVSSYGYSKVSSGTIHIEKDIRLSIDGKDVIIVEDVVDTGLTLFHVFNILSERKPRSLRVAALLKKPGRPRYSSPVDYLGFQIPDCFVVGYGLDCAQQFRNLPDIRVLEEDA